jgi:hypothetical protein
MGFKPCFAGYQSARSVVTMNEFCAELDRMRGKREVRINTPANSGARFEDEDIYTSIAEFARSGKSCHPCAYHQRCHENTCFSALITNVEIQHKGEYEESQRG